MTKLRLRDFSRIVFFTGAGMSAESGIPTYRGQGGIWKLYNYQDYACQRAFERNPEQVLDFHDVRRQKVTSCEPNLGHKLIADLQRERGSVVSIITQNIDGLHQRAGATDVVELHVGTQRSAPVASSGAVFPSRASRERKWNDSC